MECSEQTPLFWQIFLAVSTKLQLSFCCLCFSCTAPPFLPAHLPENPTLCRDTKHPGLPFSSACIIICITSKKSLKVLEEIKRRGRHAWAGEGWKFGSTGERDFHHLMLHWYTPDWFMSIISLFYLELTAVGPTFTGKGLWCFGDQPVLLPQSRPGKPDQMKSKAGKSMKQGNNSRIWKHWRIGTLLKMTTGVWIYNS